MALSNKILRIIDVDTSEALLVLLLLSQSVFLGIFNGIFDTAAYSLFLSYFSVQTLPKAFAISGLAGIIMTLIFLFLQSRIKFSKLTIINLIAIALVSFFLWYGFYLISSKWLVFFVLALMLPLNLLVLIGFWGTAGRIFNQRQGKRLFRLIDAGIITGIIIGCYSIPILLKLHLKPVNLLFISFASITAVLFFQFILSFKTDKLNYKNNKAEKKKPTHSESLILKRKLIRLMALFVAFSIVSAFFINYSFLAVTKIKYPELSSMAKFLAVFLGTVMVINLFMKTYVYGNFMKIFGIKVSLLLSPIVLILLSIIVAVSGVLDGHTLKGTGFIFFFLVLALSRLSSISLKSSIEDPSFAVLYQTVNQPWRYKLQIGINGTINELSALFAGMLLIGLGLLSFIQFIDYTYVLIFILLIWAFVGYRLYCVYSAYLIMALKNMKSDENQSVVQSNLGIATKALNGDEDEERVLFVMNMQEKLQPLVNEFLVPYLLHHKLNGVKSYAITRCDNLNIYEAVLALNNINDKNLELMKLSLTKRLKMELEGGLAKERISDE